MAKRSTTLQMLVCNEEWTKLMDDNERVDIIYLDFKKAFDSVSHKALLYKLSMYGLSGPVLLWIEAFLTDRRQRVFIGDSYSEWCKVESGVPQGSVLGPLLFLLYINDLPKVVKHSSIKLFADDTKIYRKSTSLDDRELLQEDLNEISKWCNTWHLSLNLEKCVAVYLGRTNVCHKYSVWLSNAERDRVLLLILN